MGKCNVCGKKGLFLKINSFGRCQTCQTAFEKQEEDRKQKELMEEQRRISEKQAQEEEQARKKAEYEATHKKAYFLQVLDNQYILSYQYDFVRIAMPNKECLSLGDYLSLESEPDNQYDPQAVKISSGIDKIGYLFRGKLQDMSNDFIKKSWPIEAFVDSITDDEVTCGLGFYKDIDAFDSISASLTKTSKKDFLGNSRQDNLSSVSDGDTVCLEYNYDSETYVISDDFGNEIGELSKSVSEKLYNDESDYTYTGICIENELDDNLKYKCKIKILKMPK